jgi:hypothetical protein
VGMETFGHPFRLARDIATSLLGHP